MGVATLELNPSLHEILTTMPLPVLYRGPVIYGVKGSVPVLV